MAKLVPKHTWMRYEEKEKVVILGWTPKNGTTDTDPWLTAKAFGAPLQQFLMIATAGDVGKQIIAGWDVPGTMGGTCPAKPFLGDVQGLLQMTGFAGTCRPWTS